MAPVLSSNWKNLQSKLKQESTAKEKKRKAPPTERQLHTIAKRKRLDAKQAIGAKSALPALKRNKMGISSSILKSTDDETPSASLALWAEDNDISAKDLAEAYGVGMKDVVTTGAKEDKINDGLAKDAEIGQYVAMDCEMVGVGGTEDRSVLARVSIVNYHGIQIYDSFVRPKEFVTDWRTHVSGVSPKHMATARSFEEVQADVAEIIKDRVLVGHAIKNDLDVLIIGHPKKDIRDTSRFSGFRKYSSGRAPSLKKLAKEVLGVEIQNGEHSSIEDARATMLLFRRFKQPFDLEHAKRFPQRVAGEGKKKGKSGKKGKGKR
jgi:RNA exonuclease 4